MIHPFSSIKAHHQNWIADHFPMTVYGKRLTAFKDCHLGQRCFFIGNGPSLCAKDLDLLHERGEICFAFNRIYNIYGETRWRPTYYISQDEKMLKGCVKEVDGTILGTKFVPINLKWYHSINLSNAEWFLMKSPAMREGKPLEFSDDISCCMYNSSTGMYTAAQIAAYMGFREVYMIGVDHQFRISQNNCGEIIINNSVEDYFSKKYNEDKEELYIPNTEKSSLTYIAMKEQCEQRGIRVFNASRRTKLEVFERVNFDSLF